MTVLWRRPRFTVYQAAPPRRWRIARNRYYGHATIGASVQLGSTVLSLTWAHPPRC